MNNKLKDVNLVDEIRETAEDLELQLLEDEKKYGDTWKERGLSWKGMSQETRFFYKMQDYFEDYMNEGVPMPCVVVVVVVVVAVLVLLLLVLVLLMVFAAVAAATVDVVTSSLCLSRYCVSRRGCRVLYLILVKKDYVVYLVHHCSQCVPCCSRCVPSCTQSVFSLS